ncbi:MAG: ubiquitin-like small modifier protein 1 [Halobacteriota archaeon]
MNVEVKLFATFRDLVGSRSVRVELPSGATVSTVLASLEDRYPDLEGALLEGDGDTTDAITVLRNGRHVDHFDGTATRLEPGDVISVTPPLAGGDGRSIGA